MLKLAAKAEHVTATTFSRKIKTSIIQPIKFSKKISSKRLWTTRRRQLAQPQSNSTDQLRTLLGPTLYQSPIPFMAGPEPV
ncbi:hypothetical protein, partial [Pseudomonas poae]|uniref:hypothetical protein n=1 Tax=Pseudomonas poae TaxID=200451 RepID=UPI001F478DB3